MNSLLKFATEAHGGLDRWNQLSSQTASMSVTGAVWQINGNQPELFEVAHESRLFRQTTTARRGKLKAYSKVSAIQ